jgi:hypothetical protein
VGILKTIADITNRQLYEGVQGTIIPRGLAYPLDTYMKGEVRFGRKIGFVLPLLVPDNRFVLDEDALYQVDRIVIDREAEWIEPGGYISIGEREIHEVEDVIEEDVILTTRLLADHPAGQFVYHYSNPIEVEGAYSKGQTVINVDTPWFLVRGDVIAIATNPDLVLAFTEFSVVDLNLTGVVDDIYQYQITLDGPIQRDLVDEEVIQLRAFCSYKSITLTVPTHGSALRRIVGPFLLDWASAPFVNNLPFGETMTVQPMAINRVPLGPPLSFEKNSTLLNVPIRADQFMFWDRVKGRINYDNGQNRFVMMPDENGEWRLKYTAIPNIVVPSYFARGSISAVEPSLLNNNEQVIIGDSIDQKILEFQVNGAYVPTPESVASGTFTVGDIPADNEWFHLDDGFGNDYFFEFFRTGAYVPTPGYVTVDVQASALITDVVIACVEAIDSIGILKIDASNVSPLVGLVHQEISARGNQFIGLHPQLLIDGWSTTDMTGGTDEVLTIDLVGKTTALEVAQLLAAAINTSGLQLEAEFPAFFAAFWINALIPGAAPNIPIVETVANPGFVTTGMSGGGGGAQWNFGVEPFQDGLFRIRMYPNDWQDYQLTAGVPQTIVVQIQPTDEPVERIDLLFAGDNPSDYAEEIWMSDWNIRGARIGAIQYDYVMRVTGEHNFGSTGLWAKQLFQSFDDVRLQLDTGSEFDHGYLKL